MTTKGKLGTSSSSTTRGKSSSSTNSRGAKVRKRKRYGLLPGKKMLGVRLWQAGKKQPFYEYLDRLTSARDFMSEGHVTFLSRLRPFQRKGIFERLHTIDPEGYKELRKYISTLKRIRKREEQLVREEILDEMMIVVAQAEFEEHGITEVKFLPMNGILDNIALLLASGYTREQVRDKLGVDAELITKVTPERVKLARRALPEAIAIAADQKVLQDLMAGTVGKSTVAADQISVRRRKLRMDAEVQSGKLEKASSTMAGEIDDRHKMFFDVESEEVKDDENSDAGQTGED